MKMQYRVLFLVVALLLAWGSTLGQNQLTETVRLDIEDGLSHNSVNDVYQDPTGLIWLATQYGLNLYDGHSFQWITKKEFGLSSDQIHRILVDKDGMLWLIEYEGYEGVYTIFHIDILNPNTKKVKTFDTYFDGKTKINELEIKFFIQGEEDEILLLDEKGKYWKYLGKGEFQAQQVPIRFRLINISAEEELLGVIDNQLTVLDGDGKVLFQQEKTQPYFLEFLHKTPNDQVIFCSFDGKNDHVYHWDYRQRSIREMDLGGDEFFLNWAIDRKGKTWLYGDNDLFILDEELQLLYDSRNSPDFPVRRRITNIIFDHQQTAWLATVDGLFLFRQRENKFTNYLEKGISGNARLFAIRGILKRQNKLYVNSSLGTHIIDLEHDLVTTGFSDIRMEGYRHSIVLDKQNEIWVARKRLSKIDAQTGDEVFFVQPDSPLRIWNFFQDTNEKWWLGNAEGLFFVNETGHTQEFIPEAQYTDLEEALVQHFLEIDQQLFISTNRGLFVFDLNGEKFIACYAETQASPYFLPSYNFQYAFKDAEGIFWLGTGGDGLIRWDPKAEDNYFTHFTRADGLSSNSIHAIFQDDYNRLWLSSNHGIMSMDKETFDLNTYLMSDGTSQNEFNRLSFFQDETGRIFFGGLHGVTAFHPRDFGKKIPYDAPLVMTSMQAFNSRKNALEDLPINEESLSSLDFETDYAYINLTFSLQDYINLDGAQYEYRLDNYNDEWEVTQDNQIRVPKLPYGNHSLSIRAKNRIGLLSANQINLQLHMIRPFYLQTWFLIVAPLFIFGLIGLAFAARNRALRKKKEELERIVKERTRQLEEDKLIIQEQREELEELNNLKSRFFENISHELRTPMTMLLGPIDRLLNRHEQAQDQSLLKMMKNNGLKLLNNINDIMALAKLETKRIEVNLEPIEPASFIKALIASFDTLRSPKEIEIDFVDELAEPTSILMDEEKFEKICTNYISNAIKYSPGGSKITVSLSQDEDKMRLAVSDQGKGIPEQDLTKVFDRFYRVEDSSMTEGTGIGLSLCKELATLLEGKVYAESTIGRGSVFYFEFLARKVKEQDILAVEVAGVEEEGGSIASLETFPPNGQQFSQRILVVEDNEDLRNYILDILGAYQTLHAENGKIALEVLRTCKANNQLPDLILSDIMMPEMDGLKLLAAVKSDEDFFSIPMMMLTAKASAQSKLTALRIGVDDYLTKPFLEEELLLRVKNLLKNKEGRTAQNSVHEVEDVPDTAPVKKVDLLWLEETESIIKRELTNSYFKLTDVANEMNISFRQFQRKVKMLTGLSPNNYQKEIRLGYARELLEQGKFGTISEVSYAVGIDTPHYFSKLFKDRFGRKPGELL
jgi:signal transduction histidine kinase/DNA-binding response OmpR family regulator/ligand-binding sensor domain-containing protein